MKTLLTFFASSISSAFLNYFFQILLAYKLGPYEFSQFTLNWSYFGIVSIVGSFFQYWASLNQISVHNEKQLKILFHFLALASLIASTIWTSTFFLILACTLESIVLSLIIGQAIGLGDFKIINSLNLSLSLSKIILILLLPGLFITSNRVFYIIFTSFIMTEVLHWCFLTKPTFPQHRPKQNFFSSDWLGPLFFSLLVCILPQVDILWVNLFKQPETLTIISELSFITKGVFFFQLIVAQWIFSKQKNEPNLAIKNLIKYSFVFFILLIVGSFLCSSLLPILVSNFFAWPIIPTKAECFWSGISAGMMSLFYQVSQNNIIRKKFNHIILNIMFIIIILSVAGLFNLTLINYFIISSVTYASIILFSFLNENKIP